VKQVRCFAAVDLSRPVRSACSAVGRAIRVAEPEWVGEKWVAEQNLHVTLAFFGNVAQDRLLGLSDGLSAAAGGVGRFGLAPAGLKAVPGLRRCQMVWARFDDPDGSCAELARAFEAAARPFGVEFASRPFKAHVTLVRARRPRHLRAETLDEAQAVFSAGAGAAMSVPRATFYASTLTPSGPVYEVISQLELRQH
jgi:RNA 2',3'-cyclic 3'-phosphodiesterase